MTTTIDVDKLRHYLGEVRDTYYLSAHLHRRHYEGFPNVLEKQGDAVDRIIVELGLSDMLNHIENIELEENQ